MWPFSRARATPERTWWRRVADLEDRVATLEDRREKDRADVKELKGYVYALKRRRNDEPEAPPEPDPQQLDIPMAGGRPVVSTADLARRFRIGG